jgi:hypothetical protein
VKEAQSDNQLIFNGLINNNKWMNLKKTSHHSKARKTSQQHYNKLEVIHNDYL